MSNSDRAEGLKRNTGDTKDWWNRMREIDQAVDAGRSVVFVVGSALSYDRVSRVGVPDVEGFLDLIQKETKKITGKPLELRGPNPQEKYQNAFDDLAQKRGAGSDLVDWMVRKAVLRACTLDETDVLLRNANDLDRAVQRDACGTLQDRPHDWVLPRGIGILTDTLKKAHEAVEHRRAIGRPLRSPLVITTNFDGLLEISLKRAGLGCESISLAHDKQPRLKPGAVNIWHLHGYWCEGLTMHSPRVLQFWRPMVMEAIRRHLEGALVCVIGYGAWGDSVFNTLKPFITEGDSMERPSVLWALHQQKPTVAERKNPAVFRLYDESQRIEGLVQLYLGVDMHCMCCDTANARCRPDGSGGPSDIRLTLGSNTNRTEDVGATNEMLKAFCSIRKSAMPADQVPHEHEIFKECFSEYLTTRPEDVVAWLAGQSVGKAAIRLLVAPLPREVLDTVKARLQQSWVKLRSDEDDYVVPFKTYPWAVYYRKSVWDAKGYEVPRDWESFLDLAKVMKTAPPIASPIAFGNQHRWPALMTFDILDMRQNGFHFHKRLLAGQVDWRDAKVETVFERWRELLRFYPLNWKDLSYEDARNLLRDGRAGMYFIGGFIVNEIKEEEFKQDLRVFPFPPITSVIAPDSIDAPIDGFVLPERGCPTKKKEAQELIEFLASPEAFEAFDRANPGFIGIVQPKDKYRYVVQQESAELLSRTPNQFHGMERETTKPAFIQQVIMPQFERFLRFPNDLKDVLRALEEGRQRIFYEEPKTPLVELRTV